MAVHQAADGGLARVRLPGGVLTAAQLRVVSAAAADLGDGQLELTSRANLQVRGLAPGSERQLSQRLYDAGLLPSLSHERIRNILASPLSGLDEHSVYDVLPVAAELDQTLCASAGLAELPGRFLFALDDGRGDLDGIDADAGVRAVDAGVAVLRLAGADTGVRVAWAGVPRVLTAVADAFLAERTAQGSSGWRLAELDDGPARVTERLGAVSTAVPPAGTPPTGTPPRAGTHRQRDGRIAAVAAVPLGRLTAEQAGLLAAVAADGTGTVRITPWRSVVIPGLVADDNRLTEARLVTDPASAWVGMTGCAGRPGCAKALADVRADAAHALPLLPPGRPVHWSGCDRRCGRPADAVDVVAIGNGYAVDGMVVDDVVAAVAARRQR
jgi:precorrin-3B synthase